MMPFITNIIASNRMLSRFAVLHYQLNDFSFSCTRLFWYRTLSQHVLLPSFQTLPPTRPTTPIFCFFSLFPSHALQPTPPPGWLGLGQVQVLGLVVRQTPKPGIVLPLSGFLASVTLRSTSFDSKLWYPSRFPSCYRRPEDI